MKVTLAAAGGFLISMFSFNAQAFPGSPFKTMEASVVTLVRGAGCGKGNHRNRDGWCARWADTAAARASSGANGAAAPWNASRQQGTQLQTDRLK